MPALLYKVVYRENRNGPSKKKIIEEQNETHES